MVSGSLKYSRNLYRLPWRWGVYQGFVYLAGKISPRWVFQQDMHRYLTTLIKASGLCEKETPDEFITRFSPSVRIISRKPPSSDMDVLYQVWGERQYQPVVDLMMKHGSRPSDRVNIIDAGANIGCATLFFKQAFPCARVVAIEPEPSSFDLLGRNIRINSLTDVFPLQAGLWKNDAYLEVDRKQGDGREWSFGVTEAGCPSALKGISVLDVLKTYGMDHVDLLKIDIEGAERYVFDDAARAAGFLSRTRFIAIEIHDELGIKERICRCLSDNGFVFFNAGELTIGENMRLPAAVKAALSSGCA